MRADTLAAASSTSTVYESSTSTNTGTAPAKHTASTVGKAVCEGTSTSSSALTPNALSTIQSAAVALLVSTACLLPVYRANSCSKALDSGPRMYWRESMAARTAALISSSTGGRDSGTGIGAILPG